MDTITEKRKEKRERERERRKITTRRQPAVFVKRVAH